MCHLSDPMYYLDFLGSVTRKALLLFSSVVDDDEQFKIVYEGAAFNTKRGSKSSRLSIV